jgi:hypothetical protein
MMRWGGLILLGARHCDTVADDQVGDLPAGDRGLVMALGRTAGIWVAVVGVLSAPGLGPAQEFFGRMGALVRNGPRLLIDGSGRSWPNAVLAAAPMTGEPHGPGVQVPYRLLFRVLE